MKQALYIKADGSLLIQPPLDDGDGGPKLIVEWAERLSRMADVRSAHPRKDSLPIVKRKFSLVSNTIMYWIYQEFE